MTQAETALSLGKHENYFTHAKKNTPALFRLMMIKGKGNLHAGASAYFEAERRVRIELGDMYYGLTDTKSTMKFFKDTKEDNPYMNYSSMINTIVQTAFSITEKTMRLAAYRKSVKLLKLYNAWNKGQVAA